MFRWIVESSLQYRLVVIVTAGVILFFGARHLQEADVDMLPEFSPPYVEIQTEALGLSASEVEALITTPLEADMLNGVPWVHEIRSDSIPGLSSIVLVFKPGTDILAARQMVQERLVGVHQLPNVSKPPTMINPKSSTARIMNVGLSSEKLSHVEMSVLARWMIRPRLMGVPGVANVSIWGQRQRQLQVLVDPAELAEKNITLNQIISTTGNALWVSPLTFLDAAVPGTGGWIETPNQRLGVRHILPISTPEQLAQVNVDGTNLRLGEVAQVVETHQPLIGDAVVNDESNLMLVIEKFPEVSTLEVTRDVEEALGALSLGLGGVEIDSTLYRPATYISNAHTNLVQALVWGGLVLVVAVFLLQLNWRTSLISIASIVVALIAAVMVLYWMGTSLNLLMISGIAIALVVMVDDSIITVANIGRRVRERAAGESVASAVVAGALDLKGAAMYATVIVALTVLPLFFLGGVYGSFLTGIALPLLVALAVSMFVALAVTSVLCLLMLGGEPAQAADPHSRWLNSAYDRAAGPSLAAPGMALALLGMVFVLGAYAAWQLKRDSFLPVFKETDVAVHLRSAPGTSHPEMARVVSKTTRDLQEIPGVRKASAHLGRAVMSDSTANMNSTHIWVSIDPAANLTQTRAQIQELVDHIPGVEAEVLSHTEECIQDALHDEPTEVTVRVYGDDFQVLRQKAGLVAAMLDRVSGLVDVEPEYPEAEPTIEIEVDMDKAKLYGLKPGDVRRQATVLLSGIEVGNLFEQQKVFEVVVWGKPEVRQNLSSVEKLVIDTPTAETVELGEVAHVRFAPAETVIQRATVARYIDVTAKVDGNDYATIAADINRGISKIEFPMEYRAELLSGYGDHVAANNRVAGMGGAAAILIFLLLQSMLGSWRLALATFVTIPLCLAGGVAVLWATGEVVTLGALAGFLAVLAIATRQAATTLVRYQQAEQENGSRDVVGRVSRDRFSPILASTAIVALMMGAVLMAGNVAGLELLQPMALVVCGGLVTTFLYNVFAIPALYAQFAPAVQPASAGPATAPAPGVYGGVGPQPSTH